ncbi:MAG: hypothetical protein OES14_02385 [Nitrosopumilus sp.]|nr:hypothetical protein [Nitrosopumilus sp.]MDH3824620.1 hypothetical protein [Nitrosopumilus sp.]
MVKFGNCPFCSKDGLIVPLERKEKFCFAVAANQTIKKLFFIQILGSKCNM